MNNGKIKKLALLTGGGDCPGLNSAIRAVVQVCTLEYDIQVVGIPDGFKGLLENKFVPLDLFNTTGIFARGGTMLGSSNVDTPFSVPVNKGGKRIYEDRSDEVMEHLARERVDAMIVVGGDGTQAIAHGMAQKGLKVVGIPKTIDNDLNGTEMTIGFHTAVTTAVDAKGYETSFTYDALGRPWKTFFPDARIRHRSSTVSRIRVSPWAM